MQGREHDFASYDDTQRDVKHRQILALPSLATSALHGRLTPTQQLYHLSETRLPSSFAAQHYGAISPAESQGLSRDYYYEGTPPGIGAHSDALSSTLNANPKRAYRQRRKDPSCDACRERKVKCDATETTSCTECSSRNVRCQFTKDTNRRMSSIKQVQDLERQLYEAKAQIERMRTFEHSADEPSRFDVDRSDPGLPDLSRSPRRMLKARPPHDLSIARAQLSDVGRGIMKPPIGPSSPDSPDRSSAPLSALPPANIVQPCLDSYFECVQRPFPVLHWPTFCSKLQEIYSSDANAEPEREKVALTCAVIGLGALYSPITEIREKSEKLMQLAASHINGWTDKIGLDQGLVAFLISLSMAESNSRLNGSVWLSAAIRIAQDKGLHVQGGNWSPVEGELRKRIWYSLYVFDRLVAIELGRPMLIDDEDCDTEYPELLEEEEKSIDTSHPQKPTFLLASAHVARLMAPLARSCKSLCIKADAIKKFESHLRSCMALFPPHLQLQGAQPLDPLYLSPLIHFQNARLVLYRHNISPACSTEQRTAAINNCCATAMDTASIMSRCFAGNILQEQTEQKLKFSASFLTCTHLWRCLLFLAFRYQWDAFHAILRCLAIIDNNRPINVSCGRHLDLFLASLVRRFTNHEEGSIEEDEDLIVLLSGDLQAGTSSWVWGNAESGTFLSRRQKHSRSAQPSRSMTSNSSSSASMSLGPLPSTDEPQQWRGWNRVSEAARWLDNAQREYTKQEDPNQVRIQSPEHVQSDIEQYTRDSRSRMNIANII